MGDVDCQTANGGGVGAADAAAAAAAADLVGGDINSSSTGSPRGSSRRGSAASTAAADQKLSVENDSDAYGEQHFRRRSSLLVPLAGGNNDGLGSTSGDGATGGTDGHGGSEGDGGVTAAVSSAAVDDKEAGYQEVVAWVKEHLVLPDFVPEQHWREEHNEVSPKWLIQYLKSIWDVAVSILTLFYSSCYERRNAVFPLYVVRLELRSQRRIYGCDKVGEGHHTEQCPCRESQLKS